MLHGTTRCSRDCTWCFPGVVALAFMLASCASASSVPDGSDADARELALSPADWDEDVAWKMDTLSACDTVEDARRGICHNTSTLFLSGDDVRPYSATIAYLDSPDPRVRERAVTALIRKEAVYRDPVFTSLIVEAASREREAAPAKALGLLLGVLRRPALAPPVRDAILALLRGEGVEPMRLALARTYVSGDRTSNSAARVLRGLVGDTSEPEDVRMAALRGIAGHSFGVQVNKEECDVLYALPRDDAAWTWPVLEAGLSIEFKCADKQLELLWSATEGHFDNEVVGHQFAFLLQPYRASPKLRAAVLARARHLATRSDLPLTSRFSSLIAVAQVEPTAAGPIARELDKLAAADPDLDPDLRERIGFLADALDFDAWGRIDDPRFTTSMSVHVTQCLVWKQCRRWSGRSFHPVAAYSGPDQSRRLLALLRSRNTRSRWFAAAILVGIRNFEKSVEKQDDYADLAVDVILELAAAEADAVVAEQFGEVVDDIGYDLRNVSESVRSQWVGALEALLEPGVRPGLRLKSATVLSRADVDVSRSCGVWSDVAGGDDASLAAKGLQYLSRCGLCEERWGSFVDGIVGAGIDATRLVLLPEVLEPRAQCLRLPEMAGTPLVPEPDAFERALEAAALDTTIPAILRQEALSNYTNAGLLSVEGAARVAERDDTAVGEAARRLATYAVNTSSGEATAGFWVRQNDPVVVELAKRVLLECVWSSFGTPDPECPALRRWSAHHTDAAPTLLEFLWDADPRVRLLGAMGLSVRPRWHVEHAPRIIEAIGRLEREAHPRVAALLGRVIGKTWGVNPTLDGKLERLARRLPKASARLGLLMGMLDADRDGASATLIRVVRDEPSAELRRAVAAAILQQPSEDHTSRCALWLDFAGQSDPVLQTRGQQAATGIDCILSSTSDADLAADVRATWVELVEDESVSPDVREAAIWALEYGRVQKTSWLAKLGAGDDSIARAAKSLADRRDLLGDADRGLGLADPAVHPIARDLIARSLRSVGFGGRWQPDKSSSYPELKWILGAEPFRGRNSPWRDRLPSDVAHATFAAILFDPNPRVRAIAFELLDDRLDEGPPTEDALLEMARDAAATESEKTYAMQRMLKR